LQERNIRHIWTPNSACESPCGGGIRFDITIRPMLYRALILAALTVVANGCASSQHSCCDQQAAHTTPTPELDQAVTASASVSASALVFDPPMLADELPIDLAREGRERAAFVGYEDRTTTFSYIRIDDRQTGDSRERYDRRAIIERFGSSSR